MAGSARGTFSARDRVTSLPRCGDRRLPPEPGQDPAEGVGAALVELVRLRAHGDHHQEGQDVLLATTTCGAPQNQRRWQVAFSPHLE